MTTLNGTGETEATVYESLPTIVFVENDLNDYMAAREQLVKLKLCNPIHRSHTVAGLMQYLELAQQYVRKDPTALPCAIIMELKLPQTGGLDGQALVRSNLHFRSIPIIALSSADRLNALQHAVTLGANGYLVKPFEAEKFRKLSEDLHLPLVYGLTPRRANAPKKTESGPQPVKELPKKRTSVGRLVAKSLGLFSF